MSVIRQSDILLTMDIVMNLNAIEAFKSEWANKEKNMSPDFLNTLRNIGAFESIGSSTRIEGSTLTNEEVETLLNGLSTKSFRSRDEEEVTGYAESLKTIYDNYAYIPLSENYIKQLHSLLLSHATKDERHRGEYKKVDNAVASFDNTGKEIGIIFKTASAFETPYLMNDLVRETNDMLSNPAFSSIISIGVFIVHFLQIHPFQDGNGRLSRLLTNLLLLKQGYDFIEYYSLEKIIEEEKSYYYSALRRTQMSFSNERYDYLPWLSFFTTLIKTQTKRLNEKVEEYTKNDDLNADEKKVLLEVKNLDGVSAKRIQENIPHLTQRKIKQILDRLIEKDLIEQYGKNKGTWYRAKLK